MPYNKMCSLTLLETRAGLVSSGDSEPLPQLLGAASNPGVPRLQMYHTRLCLQPSPLCPLCPNPPPFIRMPVTLIQHDLTLI